MMGGLGYVLADVMTYRPGEVIFEAGSDFSKESSSRYLLRVAAARDTDFVSVDLLAQGIDAVQFLQRTWLEDDHVIKFAYLDSWDWPYRNMDPEHLEAVRQQYAAIGRDLTEDESARHHLELAQEVHSRAAPDAVIVFDDTWLKPGGTFDGKGRDAVPWLLGKGWTITAWHADLWTNGSGVNAFYVALRGKPW
jgi:hypothetical protein